MSVQRLDRAVAPSPPPRGAVELHLTRRALMFLRVFGTRGVAFRQDTGEFYCPACDSACVYQHKRVRKFFAVYFVPVVPLDVAGEYVECRRCLGTFAPEVVEASSEAAQDEFEAAYKTAVRRVLVEMAMVDQYVTSNEAETVDRIYRELTGDRLEEDALAREIKRVRADDRDAIDYLEDVVYELNDTGKERVLRAAIGVAAADRVLREEERRYVKSLGEALEMPPDRVREVLRSETASA